LGTTRPPSKLPGTHGPVHCLPSHPPHPHDHGRILRTGPPDRLPFPPCSPRHEFTLAPPMPLTRCPPLAHPTRIPLLLLPRRRPAHRGQFTVDLGVKSDFRQGNQGSPAGPVLWVTAVIEARLWPASIPTNGPTVGAQRTPHFGGLDANLGPLPLVPGILAWLVPLFIEPGPLPVGSRTQITTCYLVSWAGAKETAQAAPHKRPPGPN
jgi:hypothetical protein